MRLLLTNQMNVEKLVQIVSRYVMKIFCSNQIQLFKSSEGFSNWCWPKPLSANQIESRWKSANQRLSSIHHFKIGLGWLKLKIPEDPWGFKFKWPSSFFFFRNVHFWVWGPFNLAGRLVWYMTAYFQDRPFWLPRIVHFGLDTWLRKSLSNKFRASRYDVSCKTTMK